jgi:hypothetical protein
MLASQFCFSFKNALPPIREDDILVGLDIGAVDVRLRVPHTQLPV